MTYLLAMPEEEAQVWIQWGTHVFKDGEDGAQRGAGLEAYLNQKLDEAMTDPQDESFFGALVRAKIDGRKLTREEQLGFANLTFAGGRDTVIHSISSTLHYLASQPESLAFLKEDVSRITHATEELFRAITPLTHIGRVSVPWKRRSMDRGSPPEVVSPSAGLLPIMIPKFSMTPRKCNWIASPIPMSLLVLGNICALELLTPDW